MKAYIETPSGTVIETESPECWTEAKQLTAKDGKARLLAESLAHLRELFPPGSDVWTLVTHVAASGMSRRISLYSITVEDGKPVVQNVSAHVARVLDLRVNRDDLAVVVSGCGMDMCFHTVYNLGRALYHDDKDQKDAGYRLNKRDL